MSENTSSTNVDSGRKDKYLEDLKGGTPSVNGFCELIKDDSIIEIVVDPHMSGRAVCDEIAKAIQNSIVSNDSKYLPMETPVHTVSREELEKLKAQCKARQVAQEKARASRETYIQQVGQEK